MAGGNAFKTKAGSRAIEKTVSKFLREIPPAERYGQLEIGTRLSRTYEVQAGVPIDASNSLLRALSPFTLEIVPPLAFGSSSRLSSGEKPKKDVGIYDAASQSNNQFYKYLLNREVRTARSQKLTGNNPRQRLEEFVAAGKRHIKQSPDGSVYAEGTSSFQDPMISDVLTAADIAVQVDTIFNTPPLVLLVNPNNMSVQFNRMHQYTERTRYGYIYQHWGEEQPRLSISGVSGAWIAGANPRDIQRAQVAANSRGQNSSVSGLQWASKKDSAAWQNLMSLFGFYMNNGYIFDTVGKSYAHHFVGAIAIKYDHWVYIGNINNFNFGYEETKQYGGIAFNFDFTVTQLYDTAPQVTQVRQMRAPTASPSDPRYSSLGIAPNPSRDGVVNLFEPGYEPTTQVESVANTAAQMAAQAGSAVKGAATRVTVSDLGFKRPTIVEQPSQVVTVQRRLQPFIGVT